VDWEAELAVVIGRGGRGISAASAREHVAGYAIVNDISARGRHKRPAPLAPPFTFDWLGSKGSDSFCPMGPGIAPDWLIDDPHDLAIRCWVNGELKQDGSTRNMLNDSWRLIEAVSAFITLEPGDVIATGTPAGVGVARGEQLADGDEVAIEIAGIGRLVNPVATA
jgi:2-keto-4-pentenoate hydratase/2-oxohepta-3-ene-1,7-dioic acid hydratase in catechol pathway